VEFIPPLFDFSHAGGRCSVTGGYVYRGSLGVFASGTYVYGDSCSGEIFVWNDEQRLLFDTAMNISSFGEDEQGELYVVDLRPRDLLGAALHWTRARSHGCDHHYDIGIGGHAIAIVGKRRLESSPHNGVEAGLQTRLDQSASLTASLKTRRHTVVKNAIAGSDHFPGGRK